MHQPVILVVDDEPMNIEIISNILRESYKVRATLNGAKAIAIARSKPKPDLILLDVMMPEMDGYEVCRRLKEDPHTQDIPIIFVTAKNRERDETNGFELGAVDYIAKPVRPGILQARVKTHIALHDQALHLEHLVAERTQQLQRTQLEIVRRLGRAAEMKDDETGMHVVRMSHYSRLIAQALDISDKWTELIFNAAPMHDVGKIGIPDAILTKKGKLDPDEWEVIKKHPEFGATIIGEHDSELLQLAREVALTHHEKWDGSGYPSGLQGEEIPLSARIVMIADVFDALTTERPYKKAWTVEKAVQLIDENSGKHFDPHLVEVFHQVLPDVLKIKSEFSEKETFFNTSKSTSIE